MSEVVDEIALTAPDASGVPVASTFGEALTVIVTAVGSTQSPWETLAAVDRAMTVMSPNDSPDERERHARLAVRTIAGRQIQGAAASAEQVRESLNRQPLSEHGAASLPVTELPTMASLWKMANLAAVASGHWGGVPRPVAGLKMLLAPGTPPGVRRAVERLTKFRAARSQPLASQDEVEGDESETQGIVAVAVDDDEEGGEWLIRNQWESRTRQQIVFIVENPKTGKSRVSYLDRGVEYRFHIQVSTTVAASAWRPEAERLARRKLRSMLSPGHYRQYILTGGFFEQGKSGVVYWLRSLKPTVAMREGVLATLCLHSDGYYHESFGGVCTPTDDVIAHLLWIRGDEAKYWGKAQHHPPWHPESGL